MVELASAIKDFINLTTHVLHARLITVSNAQQKMFAVNVMSLSLLVAAQLVSARQDLLSQGKELVFVLLELQI